MTVKKDHQRGLWKATIKRDGRDIFLGRFQTREEAVIAYEEAKNTLPPKKRIISTDTSVIRTADLAPYLRSWIAQHKKEHPMETVAWYGQRSGGGKSIRPFGAIKWLAQESGVPARRINAILSEEREFTLLRVADPLLQAMDKPYLIHTEIEVLDWPLDTASEIC